MKSFINMKIWNRIPYTSFDLLKVVSVRLIIEILVQFETQSVSGSFYWFLFCYFFVIFFFCNFCRPDGLFYPICFILFYCLTFVWFFIYIGLTDHRSTTYKAFLEFTCQSSLTCNADQINRNPRRKIISSKQIVVSSKAFSHPLSSLRNSSAIEHEYWEV